MTIKQEFATAERQAAERLIAAGCEEDFAQAGDLTSTALIAPEAEGSALLVARKLGIVAGLPVAQMVFQAVDASLEWVQQVEDAARVEPGAPLAQIQGSVRRLLAAERLALNFLGHLSGIATLTQKYVQAVRGTGCKIYDTRKTLPGWRALAKYAVRAGGGHNHRRSLADAALIKDNHLAALLAEPRREPQRPQASTSSEPISDSEKAEVLFHAVQRLKGALLPETAVMVEVESLEVLRGVLRARPHLVLLDNVAPPALKEAVKLRNEFAPEVVLEATGGITLANVRATAETGVDRISIGALTHSAPALDVAMDWHF